MVGTRCKDVQAAVSCSELFDNRALVPPHIKTDVLASSDSSLNAAEQHSKHLCLARLQELVADEIRQFITKAAGPGAAVLPNWGSQSPS